MQQCILFKKSFAMLHLPYAPAVFAVGNAYQVLFPLKTSVLMWVQVDEEGIEVPLHQAIFPIFPMAA
ncbi:MAG: hypothetical protein J6I45_08220 [Clostridia bacterium]|nr:hypothetical protein [Clostridia bacterium]